MSWNEAFARHYEEWPARMTADVALYVELARGADGPLRLGLIDVADLEVQALHGGCAREPFADDSREYVFVAGRRSPDGFP